MPPRWMWHLDEALEEHFERLKEKRKSGGRDDDDERESGPMIRNEHARGRGRELVAAR